MNLLFWNSYNENVGFNSNSFCIINDRLRVREKFLFYASAKVNFEQNELKIQKYRNMNLYNHVKATFRKHTNWFADYSKKQHVR